MKFCQPNKLLKLRGAALLVDNIGHNSHNFSSKVIWRRKVHFCEVECRTEVFIRE